MGLKFLLLMVLFILKVNFLEAQYAYKISSWSYKGGAVLKELKDVYYFEIYNEDSLLIEIRNGYKITRFEYNEKRQKNSEAEFYNDKLGIKKYFEYDSNGLLKRMHYGNRNKKGDSLQFQEFYYYDNEDQLIQMKATSGYYPDQITVYKYRRKDSNLIVTELKLWGKRKKADKVVTVYNEKGFVIQKTQKDYEVKYSYEYDQNGEWIVRNNCFRHGKLAAWNCDGVNRKTLIKEKNY